jgi:lysozyme family protein
MASFAIANNKTKANEGGLANNAADRGKLTYRGIASAFWPNWTGWPIVRQTLIDCAGNIAMADNQLGMNTGLQAMVDSFFKQNFWDVYKLDSVTNQLIADEMFDTGANMGIAIESKFLQRALNMTNRNQKSYADLVVDGVIGTQTIAALNSHPNQALVLKILNVLQGARYISIMEADPSQEVFAASWFSRVAI